MPPAPITRNTLFYGDNLPILREYIAGAHGTFKQAQRVRQAEDEQLGLDVDRA